MNVKPDHGEDSYRGSGRLAGKAAVITGADSGIGKAVAADYVELAGKRGVLMAGDLSDPTACAEVVERAVDESGRIDVLVNNAAYQMTQRIPTAYASTPRGD